MKLGANCGMFVRTTARLLFWATSLYCTLHWRELLLRVDLLTRVHCEHDPGGHCEAWAALTELSWRMSDQDKWRHAGAGANDQRPEQRQLKLWSWSADEHIRDESFELKEGAADDSPKTRSESASAFRSVCKSCPMTTIPRVQVE